MTDKPTTDAAHGAPTESNPPNPPNPQSLRVPQKPLMTKQSANSIMEAYARQSKIPLYDESDALTEGDTVSGVQGRDIPLEALRPRSEGAVNAAGRMSRGDMLRETMDIGNAYRRMKGYEEIPEERAAEKGGQPRTFDDVRRLAGSYVDVMPDDDEGLIEVLGLVISNTKANLEMMEGLYVALTE